MQQGSGAGLYPPVPTGRHNNPLVAQSTVTICAEMHRMKTGERPAVGTRPRLLFVGVQERVQRGLCITGVSRSLRPAKVELLGNNSYRSCEKDTYGANYVSF